MSHCAATGAGGVVTATRKSNPTVPRMSLPSVHDQVDPAVCDVIVAFDEPVVAGVRRADDVILHGVPNHVVVGPEERDDRLPEILGTSRVLVCLDDRAAGVVSG